MIPVPLPALWIIAAAVVLLFFRKDIKARWLHHLAVAGGEDRARGIVSGNSGLLDECEAEALTAEVEGAAARDATDSLHGDDASLASWVTPFLLSLLAAIVVGGLSVHVTKVTTAMTLVGNEQLLMLALGFGILVTHLAQLAPKLPKTDVLGQLAKDNYRWLGIWGLLLALSGMAFAVVRVSLSLAEKYGIQSYAALDLFLWLTFSVVVNLSILHAQPGLSRLKAGRSRNRAVLLNSTIDLVCETLGETREALWPEPRPRRSTPGGPAAPHAASIVRTPNRKLPTSRSAAEPPDPDEDDDDKLPYRKLSLLVATGLALMLAGSAPDVNAGVRRVTVMFDTTASVNRPELIEFVELVTEQMAIYARESGDRTELSVLCWSGRALNARSGARRWVADSLAFRCPSPFKIICDKERRRARAHLDSLRTPVIADFERSMKNLAASLRGKPVASAGSCQASFLQSADIIAAGGIAIAGGDFALEGCEQNFALSPRHGNRVFCCVLGRSIDGDMADSFAAERVRVLAKMGLKSLNGVQEARLLDWRKLFDQAASDAAAGR